MDVISEKENGVYLTIKVIPNSSKNELVLKDGVLRLKITAPPVDNKANKFVAEYLSKTFKIPKTSIEIVRGDTSREKTLFLKTSDKTKINQVINFIQNL